jgi:hypothetical protein
VIAAGATTYGAPAARIIVQVLAERCHRVSFDAY